MSCLGETAKRRTVGSGEAEGDQLRRTRMLKEITKKHETRKTIDGTGGSGRR